MNVHDQATPSPTPQRHCFAQGGIDRFALECRRFFLRRFSLCFPLPATSTNR